MDNKKIRRKRTMSYFINAADEIIDEKGIESVTLREVAKRAGYNSATIYNYFENLDHLIFYAAMLHIKDYSLALNTYLSDAENAMDRFLKIWECFCDFAYDSPEIYNAIFFPNLDKEMDHYVKEYYEFFPEDLFKHDDVVSTMLLKSDITDRSMTILLDCVNEGYILMDDVNKINDMTLLIFEGTLKRVLNDKISYDDARNNTMDYLKFIMKGFLVKDYEFYY